jgi:hypothetical protein
MVFNKGCCISLQPLKNKESSCMVETQHTDASSVSASSPMFQSPHSWSRQFTFHEKHLFYNRIAFNNCAERAVEIPVAFDFLARQADKEPILEVGNVLQHYENALSDTLGIRQRLIIDKFEVGPGIKNIDLFDLNSAQKYQTIISVSTVEHVGQTCDPRGMFGEQKRSSDLEAPLKAIAKLYDLLEVGGRALITLPFGKLIDGGWYIQANATYLDLLVTSYDLPCDALSTGFLRCIARERKMFNPRQLWAESELEQLVEVRYDDVHSGARAIAVLELTKTARPFSFNPEQPPAQLRYERSALTRNLYLMTGMVQKWVRR